MGESRLGSQPGPRRHGSPREEAKGRGGAGPGGREAGEASERPEGSGGGECRYRALHELTRLRAQRRGPERGAAPGGPGTSCEGEPDQASEGQLRGDAAAPRRQHNFAFRGLSPAAELWTGIKKGPPRKLKFPEPQEVVEELKKYLS
ncbi:Selenoprotein H [Camelus dromedarius]|uniref:Selenoprotein H n=1 Tax=Camelus dromedarius TaxID=9838 RepID=A0A5N4DKZ5_CAMDR|nr:Selenoprotein H [Camelus dromedarius]